MPPALVIRGLKKSFGASQALRGVDLTIGPAEVHALVGQNGSGKSTLVKVLAGYHAPDQGEATAHGEPLHLGDSAAAAAHDIRFVHQDLGLVDTLDAVENVALGPGFDTRMGRIRWRHEVAITQDAVRNLGYQFDVRRPVGELSPSERVGVAIARALRGWDHAGGRGLLVLDEPTASMPAPEVARLFEVIRGVRSSGTSILYVSHRFEEVFALADNVTVLRDGLVVISRPMAGLDHDQLVELLLGRRLTLEHHQPAAAPGGAALLEVQGVAAEVLEGFDLSVQPKEVVGVAGVTGSGREELAQLLFGLKQPSHGEIRLDGRPVRFRSPSDAIAAGIALVPGDRRQGLLPDAPVRENVTLVDLKPFCSGGVIQRRKEVDEVKDWIRRFDVTPGDPELDVLALSGGNQQKVVVAKWLRTKPRVLVLEEPTQGVDVGSKADIHEHLHSAAAAGVAVVVVSTDLEELVHLCDRVVVVVSGRTSAELTGPMLTSENLAQEVLASTARREAMHP